MYADDLAYVIYRSVTDDITDNLNVACEENLSIKEIAEIALRACYADHLHIVWNSAGPDGQLRKDVSSVKLQQKLKRFKTTPLLEGIRKVFNMLET